MSTDGIARQRSGLGWVMHTGNVIGSSVLTVALTIYMASKWSESEGDIWSVAKNVPFAIGFGLSAAYSLVLLCWPRAFSTAHGWIYYLPVWAFIGLTVYVETLYFVLGEGDTFESDRVATRFLRKVDLFIVVPVQLVIHAFVVVALRRKHRGVPSLSLPWNLNPQGEVECY